MAKKPTVTTLQSGFNSTETLNANFEALRDGFDNTLSLDGSTPNAMEADLDLNGNDILNAGTILINGVDYLTAAQTAQAAAEAAQAAAEAVEVVTDAAVGTVTTLAEGVSATAAATASSGTVTFDFGIPTGPTGATGDTGAGLTILGSYATEAELIAAHPTVVAKSCFAFIALGDFIQKAFFTIATIIAVVVTSFANQFSPAVWTAVLFATATVFD